jgi:hypothetical protein
LDIITTEELNIISEKINEAISKGKFSISEDGSLSQNCRQKLEELGYKIETGSQYNEPWYSISWK